MKKYRSVFHPASFRLLRVMLCFFLSFLLLFSTSFIGNAIDFLPIAVNNAYLSLIANHIQDSGRTLPDTETLEILSIYELKDYRSNSLTAYLVDVSDAYGNNAYAVIDDETQTILEFASVRSPYTQYMSEFSLASAASLTFYYSPLDYWIDNGNDVSTNVITNDIASTTALITAANRVVEEAEVQPIVEQGTILYEASAKYTAKQAWLSTASVNNMPVTDTISGVPTNIQDDVAFKCIPTTMLDIIGFWDNNGFPNLMSGTVDETKTDILAALNSNGGTEANAPISGAVEDYITDHGDYISNAVAIYNPVFYDLQYEIYCEDPCFVGVKIDTSSPFTGAHMTTGVGYTTANDINFAKVHTHCSGNMYLDVQFSLVDFICGVYVTDIGMN